MRQSRNTRRRRLVCAAALLAGGLGSVALPGIAQTAGNFPERPVKLVVPYAPGGAVDITARILGNELTKLWGHQVLVENKPGAAGMIAASSVAKAAPDGYTLFITDDGVLVSMPFFQKNMPYDTLTDLVPVGIVGMFPYMLVASSALKVKSLSELVATAKTRPGGIDYATNGVGSTHHLVWERFQRAAGITLNHIPYKSAAPALQDVMAGRVSLMIVAVSTALPYIKDGRLVSLAMGSLERSPIMPDVPTVAESGFPGFEAIAWKGVLAPKGIPPALLEKISSDLQKVTQLPAYRDALAQRGTESRTSTAQAMSQRMLGEYERTRAQIKSLNIKED
ncbi:MAG: LacI family transcriptional regulator [Herminiimonas sp.]|nr:LacI family transcriptional regulator [Herminiimonas sp.]